MPKDAKTHIMSAAPATEVTTGDPALVVAYQINLLWDAYHGADCDAIDLKRRGETTNASVVRDQANQIGKWRDALINSPVLHPGNQSDGRAISDGYCRRRSGYFAVEP